VDEKCFKLVPEMTLDKLFTFFCCNYFEAVSATVQGVIRDRAQRIICFLNFCCA